MLAEDAPLFEHSTCSAEDFMHPRYRRMAAEIGAPVVFHRKQWEWIFIIHKALQSGAIGPGKKALGFGVGTEVLPAIFAKAGSKVTATDAPIDLPGASTWRAGNQWLTSLENLPRLGVDMEDFKKQVNFEPCDMNDIPKSLRGFDFCWSSCSLEHLGSLQHGLDFIENSLDTLVPGGVSCHTTEFNCSSNVNTLETGWTVLYRRRDLEEFSDRMTRLGHTVEPIRIAPGRFVQDSFVDVPPYLHDPHLKLELEGHVTTSIGIVVTKKK